MIKGLYIAAALFLAGCPAIPGLSAPSPLDVYRTILSTCIAYAHGLTALAGFGSAGMLSDGDILKINIARNVANPICNSPHMPNDPAVALDAIEAVMLDLLQIQQEVQRDGQGRRGDNSGDTPTGPLRSGDGGALSERGHQQGRLGSPVVEDAGRGRGRELAFRSSNPPDF